LDPPFRSFILEPVRRNLFVPFRHCYHLHAPPLRLNSNINAVRTGRISAKFDIGYFYESMLLELKISLKSGKSAGHFTQKQ